MDFTLYWFMFPVSILVCTLAMLSGIGGAALFTPIFVLVFPLLGEEYVLASTMTAVTAALITQCFGFLSGYVGYRRRRLIDYGTGLRLMRVTVPIGVAGALAASLMHESVLLAGYALLVGVLAVLLWQAHAPLHGLPEGRLGPMKTVIDSRGQEFRFREPVLGPGSYAATGTGAFLTGLVSVGIGEATISTLIRKGVPVAIAAATSVLVVIVTILAASTTLAAQLIKGGGWTAVPWNLLVYDIPGVLIGGQIGPHLQGRIAPHTMRRAIAILFVILGSAMLTVAYRKSGI